MTPLRDKINVFIAATGTADDLWSPEQVSAMRKMLADMPKGEFIDDDGARRGRALLDTVSDPVRFEQFLKEAARVGGSDAVR